MDEKKLDDKENGTVIVTRANLVASAVGVKNADVQLNMLVASRDMDRAVRIVFQDGEFEKVLKEQREKDENLKAEMDAETVAKECCMEVLRTIETHRCGEGMDEDITIAVFDEPGAGGACHVYGIESSGSATGMLIQFQDGPVEEAGPNGISCEALLAVVKDRLECFQAGAFACDSNAEALYAVDKALTALHDRTLGRTATGYYWMVPEPQNDEQGTPNLEGKLPDEDGADAAQTGVSAPQEEPAAE